MTARIPALTRQVARRLNSLQQGGLPGRRRRGHRVPRVAAGRRHQRPGAARVRAEHGGRVSGPDGPGPVGGSAQRPAARRLAAPRGWCASAGCRGPPRPDPDAVALPGRAARGLRADGRRRAAHRLPAPGRRDRLRRAARRVRARARVPGGDGADGARRLPAARCSAWSTWRTASPSTARCGWARRSTSTVHAERLAAAPPRRERRPRRRGRASAGEPVWRGVSTYLAKGYRLAGAIAPSATERPEWHAADPDRALAAARRRRPAVRGGVRRPQPDPHRRPGGQGVRVPARHRARHVHRRPRARGGRGARESFTWTIEFAAPVLPGTRVGAGRQGRRRRDAGRLGQAPSPARRGHPRCRSGATA